MHTVAEASWKQIPVNDMGANEDAVMGADCDIIGGSCGVEVLGSETNPAVRTDGRLLSSSAGGIVPRVTGPAEWGEKIPLVKTEPFPPPLD